MASMARDSISSALWKSGESPPSSAVRSRIPYFSRINRAAAALGRLDDPRAIAPLIAALVTSHTTVTAGNGGKTSVTFTPGSGGLALGGGPKAATSIMQNRSVLEALTTLTDENFSWNVAAWRQWLAGQGLPPETDLRRDP